MYFPIGWPKVIKTPNLGRYDIKQLTCNRDKILFAILTDDTIGIWFCKPCVPIVILQRDEKSLAKFGTNVLVEWKPDSSKIVIGTSEGHLLFYKVEVISDQKGLYIQTDSPYANLRRDSAELFIKEIIPPLRLVLAREVTVWDGKITGIVCITMSELMLATTEGHVLRYEWGGTQLRDYTLDLRRIPFCINQQVSKAIPIVEENTFIIDIEYSPLVGGFSIVLNDGRAAFLTASSLKFDPNQVQGIWAQGIEDATCTKINHKYRLITFGRQNSECVVYYVDESTGGLEISHNCLLGTKDYPGCPGAVDKILWTPDGCALVASWKKGGIAMWSTFGALLMCSLGWDYGLNIDIQKFNPLQILSMEFATEGYQLWMIQNEKVEQINEGESENSSRTTLIQLDFVKSALAMNPCMSHQSHLYLQGDDKLYVNSADTLVKAFSDRTNKDDLFGETSSIMTLSEGRQWLVVPIPSTYSSTNWPIRYSAIDSRGQNIAVSGRTGIAHYSTQTRKWKLFGNETQEKDFIAAGGLLWWRNYIVMGCYSIIENSDELRFYPKDSKLDNKFAKIVNVGSPLLLINILQDQLVTFSSDGQVSVWALELRDMVGNIEVNKLQVIDVSSLTVHPACITSITLTSLHTETFRGQHNTSECMVLNVSGRLIMIQREIKNGDRYICSMPTVLASCVENVWVPARSRPDKAHLTEALWLFCGSHGMRVWLPLYPRDNDKIHTFMSKRIMLPFQLRIYPLAILFEDAIILGAENDTALYTTDAKSPFSIPFSILQRTSQVYLHQILRQLIRRNLGYHAWEVAKSCMSLPYFPHSLELLLHEVLEEEATSKEPIPDAQLPSVIEFIMEFPVYLQTVVQCARKTEIALWPYLFSAAGKPKDLFQECLAKTELETAASYLIILQNLEASSVSRQYATLLLNTALDQSKWELAKDLVRFLRAIDPNDVESPRNSFILPQKLGLTSQNTPVAANADDISIILGNVQGPRSRSYSTTVSPKLTETKSNSNIGTMRTLSESSDNSRKKSVPNSTNKVDNKNNSGYSAEEFFIDVILQKHARRLLSAHRLTDLGYFAAHLDFHLVTWLVKERDRAARIDDFIKALKQLHEDFSWPYPNSLASPRESVSTPNSPTESPNSNIEERLKSYKAEINNNPNSSRVGDSGYKSFQGHHGTSLWPQLNLSELSYRTIRTEPGDHFESYNYVDDMKLKTTKLESNNNQDRKVSLSQPKLGFFSNTYHLDEANKNVPVDESVISTVSSQWTEDREVFSNASNENWEVPSTQILEHLSNLGGKGSHRSEVQLRYLLQLFMEANCLEWSLMISVILRDAMAVLRTVNAAKSVDQSIESVSRLRQQIYLFHHWTNNECIGYKSFVLAIQNQISVLTKIVETKIQHQQISDYQKALSARLNKAGTPTQSRSRKSSANQEAPSSQSELKAVNVSSNHIKEKLEELNTSCVSNALINEERDDPTLPHSTGCILS